MKRVTCLYRVSIKGQVEKNDIPMQRIACREFIEKQSDWVLHDEKYEKGVSGFKVSAKKRDAILEIRQSAEAKQFDVLLVFMADRLGRRDDETPFLVEWFINNGIEVWSVVEGQLKVESHTDRLINYIRFWQAKGESLKTSQRVSAKQRQMTEEGIWRGGARPYGYDLEFKGRIGKRNRQLLDLVKNEKESKIVAEIFDLLCLAGFGTYRIADYLNAKYPDKNKIWTPRTVLSLLRNPIYTGRYRFNGTLTKVPVEELRIVSDEKFEFAQRVLKEHIPKKYQLTEKGFFREISQIDPEVLKQEEAIKLARGEEIKPALTKASIYGASLLSGILYCAHCDHRLVGTYHSKYNSRGERIYRPVYRCYNGAVRAKDCQGQRTYSAIRIEEAVLMTVRQYFSTFSTTMDALWKEQVRIQLQRKQGSGLRQLQAELNKLKTRQTKLKEEAIKALTGESVYDPEMVQELLHSNSEAIRRAEEELQNQQSEQYRMEEKLNELSKQYMNIRDWASIFEKAPTDQKKMILARIIEKITVTRNYEITIHFYLTLEDFKKAFDENHSENVEVIEADTPRRMLV